MINRILQENKMKSIFFIVVFDLIFTLIFSQINRSSTEKKGAPPVKEQPVQNGKSAIQKKENIKIEGTLLAMDLITNRIVVKSDGSLDTLNITNTTIIKLNGKNIKLRELVKNMTISLIYKKENAKNIAVSINQTWHKNALKKK